MFASFTASIASSLAVNELRGEISGPADLPGHRVATVSGSAGDAYLVGVGVGPVLVEDIDDAYRLLEDGDVEAIVYSAPVLQFHASHEGAGAITTVGPIFEKVVYSIMLSEENPELRERVNRALLEMAESGLSRQVQERWFGAFG